MIKYAWKSRIFKYIIEALAILILTPVMVICDISENNSIDK